MTGDPAPKLLCDGTLGALCRWLRAAGHDTDFLAPQKRARRDAPAQAQLLLVHAQQQGRLILTRSKRIETCLAQSTVRVLLVKDDVVFHQVIEVSRTLGLNLVQSALTRCREDNSLLVEASPSAVKGRVPPHVAATQQRFHACPVCLRVYWGATHRDAMLERLAELERLRCGVGAPLCV